MGGCSGLPDCACTCYLLTKVQLRAYTELVVKEFWSAHETLNVPVQPDSSSQIPEIRVSFTAIVSETTVNQETFQVYYLDDQQAPVYVSGTYQRLSDVEYGFVPDAPFRDGIRYYVDVWGESDALGSEHDAWIQDIGGGPLEIGEHWWFVTLPKLEVRLEPVQVLEDEKVEDIQLYWGSPTGGDSGAASWRADATDWHFAYGPETARRYRLNDKVRRLASEDSVNYYGFVPTEVGTYRVQATVTLRDSHNKLQRFIGVETPNVVQTRPLTVYSRALAVGTDYGKTGTANLRETALGYRSGIQALYPVPNVWLAQPASAIPYYSPVAASVWSSAPAGDLQLLKALLELSAICAATSGCDLMVGYAPIAWLVDVGLTSPRQAWYSMLVQNTYADHFRYITAHEAGHLYGFEHDTRQGGSGYDVRARADRRISTALMEPRNSRTLMTINSFMNELPVESPEPERLWIEWLNYRSLRNHFTMVSQTAQQTTPADSLLLATGVITPATGQVQLDPWYILEPGEWEAPPSGPYRLVFLNSAGQEIVGYTRAFSNATMLQPAGQHGRVISPATPAPFAFKVPYPAATARIQIRRNSDNALLAERTLSVTPPTIIITPPARTTWSGPQPIAWQSDPGTTRHYLVQVSTDNGATWEAQAIQLPGTTFTLETNSLFNTRQALVRVLATDGLNTASAVAGPFTIANPVSVDWVSPAPGATNVNVDQPLSAGFRAALDPTTVNSATFTLSGGPYGTVRGLVRYDAATHEVTFIPQTRLTYSTRYTGHLSATIRTLDGPPLAEGATWSFTTGPNLTPPRVRLHSPSHGALNVPRNTVVAVAWDRPLDPSSLTMTTFQMAERHGCLVNGTVQYDAVTQMATFTPATLLTPYTTYIVTLTAGISDPLGNATFEPIIWTFTTGGATSVLALTGSHADWGNDMNGDGLYEQLVIRVGVQITAMGSHVLRGSLSDADGNEITWAYVTRTLTSGAHFLDLTFDGAAIGGRGTDGPYTLTNLTLTRGMASVSQRNAYRTFAYPAARFPAPLRFGGLPDVVLLPDTPVLNAFNVRDYAQHITRTSAQLAYTVMFNTNPYVDVSLQPSGKVYLTPQASWQGRTYITIRASDGIYNVQDTFEVLVGWPHAVYLPVALRKSGGTVAPVSRNAWTTILTDTFEGDTIGWSRYGWTYKEGPPPPGGFGWYQWGLTTCRAHSGQKSAWAYGGGDDGKLLLCGAPYPDAYSLGTIMYRTEPLNLKYAAKGEITAKVWTNLAPDDEICLKVAVLESGLCDTGYHSGYYGVCRTGATNGWQDLTMDLAAVPTLGNVLGQPRVCVQIVWQADIGDSRPEGAYVDDVNTRICPQGLTEYCPGAVSVAPPTSMPPTPGVIGDYSETVGEVAFGVESNGRVHVLWTGKLNPAFNDYVFYSTSPDGVTWTPYRILSYWGGREPRIAVDNVHGRVHLVYANIDGIVHHTIVNGVVSTPTVVAPPKTYYLPGFSLPSGGTAWPQLAVAEQTGYAYVVWREAYWVRIGSDTFALRYLTWYAYWDGVTWSAPLRKINDADTFHSTITAAPDGQAMVAWFQRWEQSMGDATSPGDPIVARTAYGTTPDNFSLRQATHALYPTPQRDESILLIYAGGADAFVLASFHAMWPGHSRTYRYIWKNGAWSEPLSVAGNTSGWSSPSYVGAAKDTPLIHYIYTDNLVLKMRTEINGVLGPAQNVGNYLSARGYTGTPLAYFTDTAGGLHVVITGKKNEVAGFFYIKP